MDPDSAVQASLRAGVYGWVGVDGYLFFQVMFENFSWLVGALSPANQRGLHQRYNIWKTRDLIYTVLRTQAALLSSVFTVHQLP